MCEEIKIQYKTLKNICLVVYQFVQEIENLCCTSIIITFNVHSSVVFHLQI